MDLHRAEPWLARLEALRREADQLAGRLTESLMCTARHAGQDRHGAVRVVTDSDNLVIDLALADSWRQRPGMARLPEALLDAVADATRRRLEAWVAAVTQVGHERHVSEPDVSEPAPRDDAAPATATSREWRISEYVDHMLSRLREADTQAAPFARNAQPRVSESVGRSAHGAVKVTARGPEIIDIQIDSRWLSRAPDTRVIAELRLGFAAAQRAATGPFDTRRTARYSDLQALVGAMESVLRQLPYSGGRRTGRSAHDKPR